MAAPVPAPGSSEMPPAAPGVELAPTAQPPSADSLGTEHLDRLVARVTDPLRLGWDPGAARDPFSNDGDPEVPTAPKTDRPLPTSVFLSQTAPPITVIGGRSYRVGDVVAGLVIESIAEGRVVFRDGEKLFTALLSEPRLGGKQ